MPASSVKIRISNSFVKFDWRAMCVLFSKHFHKNRARRISCSSMHSLVFAPKFPNERATGARTRTGGGQARFRVIKTHFTFFSVMEGVYGF